MENDDFDSLYQKYAMCKLLYAMPVLAPGDKNKAMADELLQEINRMIEFCLQSAQPARCCGRRTNCCNSRMESLFHEAKQMGIVLRKSFKGDHYWIPPIPK